MQGAVGVADAQVVRPGAACGARVSLREDLGGLADDRHGAVGVEEREAGLGGRGGDGVDLAGGNERALLLAALDVLADHPRAAGQQQGRLVGRERGGADLVVRRARGRVPGVVDAGVTGPDGRCRLQRVGRQALLPRR